MKAERRKRRSVGMAKDTEDAAFFAQRVAIHVVVRNIGQCRRGGADTLGEGTSDILVGRRVEEGEG